MDDTDEHPERALARSSKAAPARVRVAVGAAILIAVAVVVVAVIVTASRAAPTAAPASVTVASGLSEPDVRPSPGRTTPLFVHVLGAVARPGLYQLHPGARVVDAVGAAGGLTADAEPAGVNLARPVADGEQLVVPRIGEAPPAPPGAPAAGAQPARGGKVNLNTASQQELETLPRVGPALAQRILAWRGQNGRFATVDDLKNVTGIGQKTFEQLRDLVAV